LVASARDTLENAIQLCAKVCSSGRYLEAWELEAIVHYYNTIDYKIKDLKLSQAELESLQNNSLSYSQKAALLESKYKLYSGATFLEPKTKKARKLGVGGDPRRGKELYVQSCLACHSFEQNFTSFKLDTSALSISFLKSYAKKNHPYSIYNIVRKGTTAEFAIREYMPHYTAERMSEQQLEDLASYILF
jgi:mono/diheme cytochrome c family protein